MTRFRSPRLVLNPALKHAVHAADRDIVTLSILSGIRHPSRFSFLINSRTLPRTSETIKRLEKIADLVGFNKSQLFIDGGSK